MTVERNTNPGANRFQRRLLLRGKQPTQVLVVKREFRGTFDKLNQTAKAAAEVTESQGHDLTNIIYRGSPFVCEWLSARKDLPQKLDHLQGRNLKKPFIPPEYINQFDDQDFYTKRVSSNRLLLTGGISLSDIESMPLLITDQGPSLAREDINEIDRIFKIGWSGDVSSDQQIIRQTILCFVTQDEARPDLKISIPDSLRPLHIRLKAYFDHYTNLIRDIGLSNIDDFNLFTKVGRDKLFRRSVLSQFLGCYMPARLGLTPSSTIKLLETHAENSYMGSLPWRRAVLETFEMGAKEAIREKGLPEELGKYLLYDKDMDQRAAGLVLNHFGKASPSEDELMAIFNKQQDILGKLVNIYLSRLQVDLRNSQNGFLDISMNDHPLIDKVRVASQYRRTLMLILMFKDKKTHLTLEVDTNKEVFGFPAKLLSDNPIAVNQLAVDVLGAVLDTARVKYSFLEPFVINSLKMVDTTREFVTQAPKVLVALNVPKPNKRRQRQDGQKRNRDSSTQDDLPTNVVSISPPKFVVFHSRDEVQYMLGKNIQEKDVDRMMRAIGRFEYGRGDYKKLKEDIVEGEDLYEIRIKGRGGLRVLARHLDGAFFALAKAGPRSEIFNIRRRGN